jgi:4-amino-4-deoxy-L-arabinose transferase-like glycosyltransferase
VAVGGVARVVHTLLVAPWPPPAFGDEYYYAALAKLISLGEDFVRPAELLTQGVSVPTAERPPLYPLVLAGLAKIGVDPDVQRLLGAVTGAGEIVVVGLLARRLAGARAGLIAAAMARPLPHPRSRDGALMTESLYGVLAGLALLAGYRLVEAPGVARVLVLGAVGGAAALTRGEALLLLP